MPRSPRPYLQSSKPLAPAVKPLPLAALALAHGPSGDEDALPSPARDQGVRRSIPTAPGSAVKRSGIPRPFGV